MDTRSITLFKLYLMVVYSLFFKDLPPLAKGWFASNGRKKRKWDQPAEHFISAAAAVPGLPLGLGGVIGISHPAAVPLPVTVTDAGSAQLLQSVSIPQNAAEIIHKLTQVTYWY